MNTNERLTRDFAFITFIKYWYFYFYFLFYFSRRYFLACLILALSREAPNKPKLNYGQNITIYGSVGYFWDPNNWFNPDTFLCISQVRTWISNAICHGLFYVQLVEVRSSWGSHSWSHFNNSSLITREILVIMWSF